MLKHHLNCINVGFCNVLPFPGQVKVQMFNQLQRDVLAFSFFALKCNHCYLTTMMQQPLITGEAFFFPYLVLLTIKMKCKIPEPRTLGEDPRPLRRACRALR